MLAHSQGALGVRDPENTAFAEMRTETENALVGFNYFIGSWKKANYIPTQCLLFALRSILFGFVCCADRCFSINSLCIYMPKFICCMVYKTKTNLQGQYLLA
jgi:hypothetical protein